MVDKADRNYKWVALSCTTLGALLSVIDGTVLTIALPVIARDLHTPLEMVMWTLMIYMLSLAILVPTIGRFADIVGRKKRFIKLFGNRVNLDETERLVESAFCGLHCACAGRDEQMSIFVTDAAQTAAVKRFIAEKTGIHATAFSVAPIETIPKNGAGKTLYAELQGGAH